MIKFCLKIGATATLTMLVAGCSYIYDTFSFMRDGHLYFGVEPGQKEPGLIFRSAVRCARSITVEERDRDPVTIKLPDGSTNVEYPPKIVWEYNNLEAECPLAFPIKYGVFPEESDVEPKPLKEGVVYQVSLVSSGGGYGGHDFEWKSMNGSVDMPRE